MKRCFDADDLLEYIMESLSDTSHLKLLTFEAENCNEIDWGRTVGEEKEDAKAEAD